MKKKIIAALAIVVVIAVAVLIGLDFNKKQNNNNKKNTSTTVTSTYKGELPGVNIYYGNQNMGTMNGYVMEMEEEHMRDIIVPANTDRKVPVEIIANDNQIKEITYEIKSTEDDRLVDSGIIEDWKENNNKVSFEFQASAIMEQGKEYFWKIIVKTDKYEKVNYYARIMVTNKEFVTEQINFALDFSNTALKRENASKLAQYIEPDDSVANDNMGKTTLKSSYSNLVWGEMKPEKTGDVTITAKEFCIKDSGEAGTYTLNYQIKITNVEKVEEKYNVSETITVWSCAGRIYVLAYSRELNQIWIGDKNTIGGSFIDFGIQKETKIDFVESPNQKFMSFQINGDVYVMNLEEKKINKIYGIDAKSSSQLNETKARVITVDDNGNVDYMIYGYSRAKEHVGENGISILRYKSSDNTSKEAAFVPCKVPAYNLEHQLSKLCYVGDGTLYIMMNNTIYFANLQTKEWGVLVENVTDGSFAINGDGSVLAYNTGGGAYDEESITVVNLKDGNKNIIQAGAGNIITVYGYIGDNIIYGIGSASDIGKKNFIPINRLMIANEKLEEIKSYEPSKVYIMGVEVTDNIINIKRYKNGRQIEDDQLLDNTMSKKPVAKSSYYVDDLKKKELALSFENNLNSGIELIAEQSDGTFFNSSSKINAIFESKEGSNYYAYGYGILQGIYGDRTVAEQIAKENCGLVTDNNGHKVWVFEENYE